MGCRGYKVYRHMRRYYVYFIFRDSHPESFGLQVLDEIPRNATKERFEEWLKKTREYVYDQRDSEVLNDPEDSTNHISDLQPTNCLSIVWIYEIDLDNLVFHVNNCPLFRLDNMPPDDVFIKSISYDHFGNRALHEHTPAQYRYDWRAPPPTPTPESLAAYDSCHIRSSTSSIHELLDVPVALSSVERVRTAFIELLVARRMTEPIIGYYVRILENVPDRDRIPRSMFQLALSLVKLAVGLPIYPFDDWLFYTSEKDFDLAWIRRDVCLRITTHLDDEDNLRASIGHLVHYINTIPDKVGTIYGIACSIFHCAIVRVDKDLKGTSVAHTSALQFLPSFYARKMSTQGIEALSRLGCQSNGVELLDIIFKRKVWYQRHQPSFTAYKVLSVMAVSVAERVPVEVWRRIGDFFTKSSDLVKLASISPQALSAAADLARYPWVKACRYPTGINEFRLVEVVGSAPPVPETTERTKNRSIRKYYQQLGRAKFIAIMDGRRVTVDLVQDDGGKRHDPDKDEELECIVPGGKRF